MIHSVHQILQETSLHPAHDDLNYEYHTRGHDRNAILSFTWRELVAPPPCSPPPPPPPLLHMKEIFFYSAECSERANKASYLLSVETPQARLSSWVGRIRSGQICHCGRDSSMELSTQPSHEIKTCISAITDHGWGPNVGKSHLSSPSCVQRSHARILFVDSGRIRIRARPPGLKPNFVPRAFPAGSMEVLKKVKRERGTGYFPRVWTRLPAWKRVIYLSLPAD